MYAYIIISTYRYLIDSCKKGTVADDSFLFGSTYCVFVCGWDYIILFIIGKNVNITMHSRRQNVALTVDYLSYTNEMTLY